MWDGRRFSPFFKTDQFGRSRNAAVRPRDNCTVSGYCVVIYVFRHDQVLRCRSPPEMIRDVCPARSATNSSVEETSLPVDFMEQFLSFNMKSLTDNVI